MTKYIVYVRASLIGRRLAQPLGENEWIDAIDIISLSNHR